MSRSSFPNVEEFRARSAKLGFTTGGSKSRQSPTPESEHRSGNGRLLVLWAALGLLSASLLGWLVVDQGGMTRFAAGLGLDIGTFQKTAARYSAPTETEIGEISALRQRLAILERRQRVRVPDNTPLSRQILTEPQNLPAPRVLPPSAGQLQVLLGAPVQTGSLPPAPAGRPKPARTGAAKQDAPDKSSGWTSQTVASSAQPAAGLLPAAGVERSRLASRVSYALDLGGYATLSKLTNGWRRIQAGNADLLAELTPLQVTEFNAGGKQAFRLIAGPIDKLSDAIQICAIFRSRGFFCRQTTNAGAPL